MNKYPLYFNKANFVNRIWKKLLRTIYREQWALLVKRDNCNIQSTWQNFKLLTPPKDRFWADPFPWQVNGESYVFYEELPYDTMQGHISCMVLTKDLDILSNEIVLKQPYHLSYPFLVEHKGRLYMIPETRHNRVIEIYECTHFPDQWEKIDSLINNIEAVDATLLKTNDKWWMFTNVVEPGGNAYDSLHLYFSDTLISTKWTPHPLNPIVHNIRSARPAGRIINDNHTLIRPSQDCSTRYGYAINFQRIDQLTETDYKETLLTRFTPPGANKRILATHTWNRHGDLLAIDAEFWRRK